MLQYNPSLPLTKQKSFNHYPFLKPNKLESLVEENKESKTGLKSLEDTIEENDQWLKGVRSRINDRKTQFKRKRDTVGFRVAPESEKSLIKPSDFTFLDKDQSLGFLDKWNSFKELKQKPFKNKKFKKWK